MKDFVGTVSRPVISISKDGTPIVNAELAFLAQDLSFYRGDSMLHVERPCELEPWVCLISREQIDDVIKSLQRIDATLKDLEERVIIEPPSRDETDGG